MFSKLPQLLMLMLVVLPMVMVSDRAMARAEEDEVEEEDEGVVEEEGGEGGEEAGGETLEDEGLKTTSPDAETVILFTKPTGSSNMELPAGQITEFLVGFTNKGDPEMIVDSMEASLRYPMDFTFHLQNFSAINYVKNVKAKQQATVAYSFIAADAFAGSHWSYHQPSLQRLRRQLLH